MTRSYCSAVIILLSYWFSGITIGAQAADTNRYTMRDYRGNPSMGGSNNWLYPPKQGSQSYTPFEAFSKESSVLLDCIRPEPIKKDDTVAVVQYTSAESIVFDSKHNVLSLYGKGVLDYKDMKLEADRIALHLTTHILTAEGKKDQHNQLVGNPIFTYKDVTEDKYGKKKESITRVFYMEKIEYNIYTKRALVYRLLTKQTDAIVKSEQVKKENETTFYTEDMRYTTCSLAYPHFYIHAKKAKMIQDQQITSGPFQFYFDDVPTPLGLFFGILFLPGKRKHGIIPGEMLVENDDGFGIKEVGYYVSLGDYADFKIIGSIYENGFRSFNPEFRYKRRYQFEGDINYTQQHAAEERNTSKRSFKWKHKTVANAYNKQSINIDIDYTSKGYHTSSSEEKKHKSNNESAGNIRYRNKIGPFDLTIPLRYKEKDHHYIDPSSKSGTNESRYKKWNLPELSLATSWWPIKESFGLPVWCNQIRLDYNFNFINSLQNLRNEGHIGSETFPSTIVPSSSFYRTCGANHRIKLKTMCKLFNHFNVEPDVTYEEAWYGKKLEHIDARNSLDHPGWHRAYTCHFGCKVDVNLYQNYFQNKFRIVTVPEFSFTYSPDISKNHDYFKKVEGKSEPMYVFEGCGPSPDIHIEHRAVAKLRCKLRNRIEFKIKTTADPNIKKENTKRIKLLEKVDFGTEFDWHKPKHRLEDITLDIASGEIPIGRMLRASFEFDNRFDPYLPSPKDRDDSEKEDTPFGWKYKEKRSNELAWEKGKCIGQLRESTFRIKMNFDPKDRSSERKREAERKLLRNIVDVAEEENKINFDKEPLWHLGGTFCWGYKKHKSYVSKNESITKDSYINLDGNIKLTKWLLSATTAYDFVKKQWKLSSTKLSIQRDLHCFILKYAIEPLRESSAKKYKYAFSLGFKADALKNLKLPRKRTFATLGDQSKSS
ncbi:MAG: putative LPS assembly protein LptD [Candidatus Cardinium sp.]|nr:putative LPS assembly protein LptD [Candidatus Cardinium sp.]